MARRLQISVIGYDTKLCTRVAYQSAYEVGKELARAGVALVNGGLGGVMEAAAKGAREAGGIVVGIVPGDNDSEANKYSDIVVSTGVGFSRDFFVVYSGDAVVIVGGGAGTLIEVAAAYLKGKPLIAVKGTGGMADKLADQYIDERRATRVIGVKGPLRAVKKAIQIATHTARDNKPG